jgi:hypothetical protein
MQHPALGGEREPYCKRAAWCWLLEHAAWKPMPFDVAGRTIILQRGQISASIRGLADAWGWRKDSTARWIERLKTETLIETDIATGRMLITICNYEHIVGRPQETATGIATADETVVRQLCDTTATQNRSNTIPPSEGGSPSIDLTPEGVIFRDGLRYLMASGIKEQNARAMLGKWRASAGNGALIEIIFEAQRRSVSDPVAWIEKATRARAPSQKLGML